MSYIIPANDSQLNKPYDLDLARRSNGGWIWNEITLPSNVVVTTSDVINIFGSNTLLGWTVTDWWVDMEQVDTNATPTVAFHIGVAGDPTAISGTTGLRWESSNTVLGRSANFTRVRAPNSNCMNQNGIANMVGLQCSVLPATAAWANKRIRMGLCLAPALRQEK